MLELEERIRNDLRKGFRHFNAHDKRRGEDRTKELIEELMSSIDFESTMARLGIEVRHVSGDQWVGMCPDHVKYTGRTPSDPKWYINSRTGQTFCQTEGRGGSIVSVAQHVWGLPTWGDAYDALANGVELALVMPQFFRQNEEQQKQDESNEAKLRKALDSVMPIFMDNVITSDCERYFAKDGICLETIENYGVSHCNSGYYRDRALLPFIDGKQELCGYIAIDTLGKEKWAEQQVRKLMLIDGTLDEDKALEMCQKKYRKTLYAPGFNGRNHLYGLYEDEEFLSHPVDELMLVEGERDCLKMKQEGIPCLSIHGTYLKDGQIKLLMDNGIIKNLKRLYLGFDMDKAGDKACEDITEKMSEYMDWNRIYTLVFPDRDGEKQDPKKFSHDEMTRIMAHSVENGIRSRN